MTVDTLIVVSRNWFQIFGLLRWLNNFWSFNSVLPCFADCGIPLGFFSRSQKTSSTTWLILQPSFNYSHSSSSLVELNEKKNNQIVFCKNGRFIRNLTYISQQLFSVNCSIMTTADTSPRAERDENVVDVVFISATAASVTSIIALLSQLVVIAISRGLEGNFSAQTLMWVQAVSDGVKRVVHTYFFLCISLREFSICASLLPSKLSQTRPFVFSRD